MLSCPVPQLFTGITPKTPLPPRSRFPSLYEGGSEAKPKVLDQLPHYYVGILPIRQLNGTAVSRRWQRLSDRHPPLRAFLGSTVRSIAAKSASRTESLA